MERMERTPYTFAPAGLKLLIAATIFLGLSGLPQTTALAGDGGWRVSDIQGVARVRHGTQAWRPLARGQKIPPQSQVETGKSGRLLLVRPGDSIAVSPNSRFAVPKDADRASTRAHPITQIVQKAGTLLFKITTRPDKPFGVKTPYLAALIKGTTFTVSVKPDNAALHVSKGAVQVSSVLTGQSVLVRPGQTAAVGPANGGRLQMIGAYRPKPGEGKAATDVAKTPLKSKSASTAPGATPAVAPAAGLRIGKTIGARRVNIARVSNGLLFEVAPAASPRGLAMGTAPQTPAAPDARSATPTPVTLPVAPQAAAPLAVAPPVPTPPALDTRPLGNAMGNNGFAPVSKPVIATGTNIPPALGLGLPAPRVNFGPSPGQAATLKLNAGKPFGKKK